MTVNETINNIIVLGKAFVKHSQTKVLLLYPTVTVDKDTTLIVQPFSNGIVFSYALDDEPIGILLETGRVWSYQEYNIVQADELFDEETWNLIEETLEGTLEYADE